MFSSPTSPICPFSAPTDALHLASRERMAHILSISYDAELLRTRKLLLERRGHCVTSAEGFAETFRICADHNATFDLMVLGHSIPHQDKRAMVKHCRNTCSCRVLALLRENEPPVEEATRSVSPDPDALLAAVQEILTEASGASTAVFCP